MVRQITLLSILVGTLLPACSNSETIVQFDNNTGKKIRFVKALPTGEQNQVRKVEVENLANGATSSKYSLTDKDWTSSETSDVQVTVKIDLTIFPAVQLTGMQEGKNNIILVTKVPSGVAVSTIVVD